MIALWVMLCMFAIISFLEMLVILDLRMTIQLMQDKIDRKERNNDHRGL